MSNAVQPIDWPALVLEALADVKANLPLPPPAPTTEADTAALLSAVQANLPAFAARVQANPGLITGAGRILTALAAQGETWAAPLKAALDALPGDLATAEQYIPTVIGLITAFSPATGSPWNGRKDLP